MEVDFSGHRFSWDSSVAESLTEDQNTEVRFLIPA